MESGDKFVVIVRPQYAEGIYVFIFPSSHLQSHWEDFYHVWYCEYEKTVKVHREWKFEEKAGPKAKSTLSQTLSSRIVGMRIDNYEGYLINSLMREYLKGHKRFNIDQYFIDSLPRQLRSAYDMAVREWFLEFL